MNDETFLANKEEILILLRNCADDGFWNRGQWEGKRHIKHWAEDVLAKLDGKPPIVRIPPVVD